ncbi:MAG: glycogen/starch synthase [Candidatus Dormibacteraeota bacterium]|nr:glycogen/starch synthase [Candidatus Dormibacteraeota bacterium]
MARPLHVAFIWHMHQPYYRDDLGDTVLLPWVRLRCAKDYYKMPALLDEYPAIKQTFNLVPSLTEQIQRYVDGPVNDIYLELTRRPVADLNGEERAFVARWMTESSQLRRVRQSPRYLELVRKREDSWSRDPAELTRLFSDAELLDLQVWFNLSWLGPEVIEVDRDLGDLVRKGWQFSDDDKEPVIRAQMALIRKVLPKYREVQDRGQAELITTPYYHPILPLLADVASARVSQPAMPLPRLSFRHPEGAAEQLRLGVASHQQRFGRRPRGVWPPEQAISDEALALIGEAGFTWAVSDEGLLARAIESAIHRDGEGVTMRPEALYQPYRVDRDSGSVDLVFRDARLSNLIGFDYQQLGADEAASDLIERLRAVGRRQEAGKPLLAVIALDGENCWDNYEANGNHFLRALYAGLSAEPELTTVTVSEFLSSFPARASLPGVQPGSWIEGTLDTWVGDPEHNAAWDLLAGARQTLADDRAASEAQRAVARREVLIAEGSDWFWWFGRSHDSGMDVIWDNLFRLHLRNIYTALGRQAPAALFHGILREGQQGGWKRPDRLITPRLNGLLDDREWDAAGYLDATALFGAMHPPRGAVRRIWFGSDRLNLYLRFDTLREGDLDLRILFNTTASAKGAAFTPTLVLRARRAGGAVSLELARPTADTAGPTLWSGAAHAARELAFALPLSALQPEPGHAVEMIAVVNDAGGKPLEQLPPSGSITVRPAAEATSSNRPLRILFVSAEVAPFAKVGGLADVAGSLPKALKALGHDVRVVLPRYGTIDAETFRFRRVLTGLPVPLAHQPVAADVLEGRIGADIPVYLIENQQFFGREGMYGFWDDDARFIYFSRAALEMLHPLDFKPDVIHVNDWHTAVIPNMLARLYRDDPFYAEVATALTIHNLAFQGAYGYGTLHLAGLEQWGLIKAGAPGLDDIVNLLGRGVHFSDAVNTVSDRYAQEILTPEFGEGMDPLLRRFKGKLTGIRNGIDDELFNPATDPAIQARYDVGSIASKVENKLALQRELGLPEDPGVLTLGLISRLYDQKGLDLIANILWGLMRLRLQFVVLGMGDPRYEDMFRTLARDNREKVSTTIGFRPVLAQRIYAGADAFLMPSRFEPCGLGQLISLRYGTIPIVRATGGLADTVDDWDPVAETGNGFVFEAYDHWDLYAQVVRALETFRQPKLWRRLQANAMQTDVSWTGSAQQYVELYRSAMARRADAAAFAGDP